MRGVRTSLEHKSSPAPKRGTKRSAAADASPPPAKRGRGRPKKVQKTLEETMGGGEDDAEDAEQAENNVESSTLVKKARGRPKKVRVTSGDAEDSVMENGIENDSHIAEQLENSTASFPPTKKSRGRPKKVQARGGVDDSVMDSDAHVPQQIENNSATSPPIKKARGRPKKVQATGGAEHSMVDNGVEEDAEVTELLEKDPSSPPIKKSRGRPKKTQATNRGTNDSIMDNEDDADISQQMELKNRSSSIKKSRGRAKKLQPTTGSIDDSAMENDFENDAEASMQMETENRSSSTKKSRGRPEYPQAPTGSFDDSVEVHSEAEAEVADDVDMESDSSASIKNYSSLATKKSLSRPKKSQGASRAKIAHAKDTEVKGDDTLSRQTDGVFDKKPTNGHELDSESEDTSGKVLTNHGQLAQQAGGSSGQMPANDSPVENPGNSLKADAKGEFVTKQDSEVDEEISEQINGSPDVIKANGSKPVENGNGFATDSDIENDEEILEQISGSQDASNNHGSNPVETKVEFATDNDIEDDEGILEQIGGSQNAPNVDGSNPVDTEVEFATDNDIEDDEEILEQISGSQDPSNADGSNPFETEVEFATANDIEDDEEILEQISGSQDPSNAHGSNPVETEIEFATGNDIESGEEILKTNGSNSVETEGLQVAENYYADTANQINGGSDKESQDLKIGGVESPDALRSSASYPAETDGLKITENDDVDDADDTVQMNGGLDMECQGSSDGVDGGKNAFDEVKADAADVRNSPNQEPKNATEEIRNNNHSVIEDVNREVAIPSSILEKGIIYFFFRGRVGVEEPHGVEDVARSYIVLRPLPLGAKLGDGPLEDSGNARLLALPKKTLPKTRQDRFLVFVEQANATIKDLREQFSRNDYSTNTSGTSHIPAATPFAEGVYAITSTGRESHLAYHITMPAIGEIQKELGLNERGSYVVSAKNPTAPSPANATLSNPAQYPEHIQSKFRELRWMPLEPELLRYENTQFLLIGEGMGDMDKATEEMSWDRKDAQKETPGEEMEKLESEDHARIEGLTQDDAIFADLGLSSKEYPKTQTTW